MKTQTGNRIRLGIFVIVGLLLFIIGIYFVGKKQNLFSTTFNVRAVFKDVSGLQVGNNVRFAGINVGIIDDITIINDTSIRVEMEIQEEVRKFIKRDSKAIIGSEGIMGNKILIITPGSSNDVIKNRSVLASTAPVNMDDILKSLKVTIDNAAVLTGDLSVITNNIRTGKGTIGKLFMDTMFAKNIDRTVVNIQKGAGGFQENMEAAKSNILFRGYFRKKARQAEEKQQQDSIKNANSKKKKK